MDSTNKLAFATLAVATLSGICLVIGFSTPYWSYYKDIHGGLWESCVPECTTNPAFNPDKTGVFYLHQIMFTASLILTAVSFITLLVYVACKSRRHIAILVVSIVFAVISVLMNLGTLFLMAYAQRIVSSQPFSPTDPFKYGWSYALMGVSGGLQLVSITLSIVMGCGRSPLDPNSRSIVMTPYERQY